jgi:hypothetical protein
MADMMAHLQQLNSVNRLARDRPVVADLKALPRTPEVGLQLLGITANKRSSMVRDLRDQLLDHASQDAKQNGVSSTRVRLDTLSWDKVHPALLRIEAEDDEPLLLAAVSSEFRDLGVYTELEPCTDHPQPAQRRWSNDMMQCQECCWYMSWDDERVLTIMRQLGYTPLPS